MHSAVLAIKPFKMHLNAKISSFAMEKKFSEWLEMALKCNRMRLIAKSPVNRSGLKALLEAVWILTGLKALVMAFGKQKEGSRKVGQVKISYV